MNAADPALTDAVIAEIRVHELRFDLSPPLRLPGGAVDRREYVVMEAVLADGRVGTGYVLTRGAPVFAAAVELADRLVGGPAADALAQAAAQRGRTPAQRARALADVCAWDLAGQEAGVPVWRLIADAAEARPALAVAGYRRAGESTSDFAARLALLGADGVRGVKIAAEGAPATQELLSAVRASGHGRDLELCVDLGYAGGSPEDVLAMAESWSFAGLTWIEDPFPAVDVERLAAVRAAAGGRTAFGAGDEAPPSALLAMLEQDAVDVLRADVTTTGGLTGLLDVVARSDRRMSLHIYPEIHRHVACAVPLVQEIELFLPQDPFDFVDRFIHAEAMDLRDGCVVAPEAPGLGLAFDPRDVASCVTRSARRGGGA